MAFLLVIKIILGGHMTISNRERLLLKLNDKMPGAKECLWRGNFL